MTDDFPQVPLDFERRPVAEMRRRARAYRELMQTRRSVRAFSDEAVPEDVVREAIGAAAMAPSGANKQPWTFVMVTEAELKSEIREAAEVEERRFYEERATEEWLEDLAHLDTGPEKPYLEEAPALIALFAQVKPPGGDGGDSGRHYYVKESVGIACGMLISALHYAGLATLTYTPSPMGFLEDLLERPENERAFLLLPVGYPAEGCEVPDIGKKDEEEYLVVR